MSTYSNRLQPALQNLLLRVLWLFRQRKSLVKPVMQQKTCNYNVLFGSSAWDRHARHIYQQTLWRSWVEEPNNSL